MVYEILRSVRVNGRFTLIKKSEKRLIKYFAGNGVGNATVHLVSQFSFLEESFSKDMASIKVAS